jgi:hypothetical protein
MLVTFLVLGLRAPRSASCTRSAQAQHTEEVLFGLKIKRAGISFFSGKDSMIEQNSGLMGNRRLIESCQVFKGAPIAISISAIVISRTQDSGVRRADLVFWLREIASCEKCSEGVNLH